MKADLATRLHCHEVVCKTALKLAVNTPGFRHHGAVLRNTSLQQIGAREFGLSEKEASYCLNRARNFLADVQEAERRRNKQANKEKGIVYESI